MAEIVVPGYRQLLAKCQGLVDGSFRNSKMGLICFYWDIGCEIGRSVEGERAAFGSATVKRLSSDLRISKTDLYNSMKLANRFEKEDLLPELTWSHYRVLLPLGANACRTFALKAARQKLSVSRLHEIVRAHPRGASRNGERESKRGQIDSLLKPIEKIPAVSLLVEAGLAKTPSEEKDRILQMVEAAENKLLAIRQLLGCVRDAN